MNPSSHLCDNAGDTTFMLRRLLSIVLFAATVLPAAAPMLLAGSLAESSVPMCCRRNGAHHCDGMMAMTQAASGQTTARAPQMKCPFQQRALGAVHLQSFTVASVATEATGLLREPAPAAQAECLRRIAFDRARRKRGPPAARTS
jgi:hypothetical protein